MQKNKMLISKLLIQQIRKQAISDHRPSVRNKFLRMEPSKFNNVIKTQKKKSPMTYKERVNVAIISNGFMNNNKSLLIGMSNSSLLINCGDGTQRILDWSSYKPKDIEHILFTKTCWDNVSNLMGLSKSLSESNNKKLFEVHAPFYEGIDTFKGLIMDKESNCVVHHFDSLDTYKSKEFTRTAIPMKNEKCVSYLFEFNPIKPKILIDKLNEYNLKPGPWIQGLIDGIDYKSDDGQVLVKAADVLDYSNENCRTTKKILILDFQNETTFDFVFESNLINQKDIVAVFHLTHSNHLHNKKYLNWIKNYANSDCIHLYLDEMFPNIDLSSIYNTQAKLNLINQSVHPLLPLQIDGFKKFMEKKKAEENLLRNEGFKIIQSQTLMNFIIRPGLHLDTEQVRLFYDPNDLSKIFNYIDNSIHGIDGLSPDETKIFDNIKTKLDYKKMLSQQPSIESLISENDYPKVLFLGTASSRSTIDRNVTSIFLKLSETTNIMFDCGDSTYGQMAKFFCSFENDELNTIRLDTELANLKMIFLSHNHLDHYNNFPVLIEKRYEAFKRLKRPYEKLTVIYPSTLYTYIATIKHTFNQKLFDLINKVPSEILSINSEQSASLNKPLYFHNHNYIFSNKQLVYQNLINDLNFKSIKTVPVKHIRSSFGISIEINQSSKENGVFKLVYSSDCRPSSLLATVGKNCDLLIHESTFDSATADDAVLKNHSTLMEALSVSKEMEAKYTILTHFSSRFGLIGNIDEIPESDRKKFVFAYDFMYFSPKYFESTHDFMSYLKCIFREKYDENTRISKRKSIQKYYI